MEYVETKARRVTTADVTIEVFGRTNGRYTHLEVMEVTQRGHGRILCLDLMDARKLAAAILDADKDVREMAKELRGQSEEKSL